MGVIAIDYHTLTLVVVLLFAAVGFSRGWLKESITTLLLVALVALLYKPELLGPIVNYLNKILKLIRVVIVDAGRFDLKGMAKAAEGMPDIFVPENPYNFLLWLLIILIVLSYVGTRFAIGDKALTPISRILGGLAGAINGFIAVSLFKEYLLKYFEKLTPAQAAAAAQIAAPRDGVSIAVQNLPQQPFIQSVGPLVAILAGAFILVTILSNVFKWK